MSKMLQRLLPLVLAFVFFTGAVRAQQSDRPPGLNLGDAVVSGFSGTLASDPKQPRPANKSVVDLTFINPDGPSARIIGLGQPGYVWDGRLFKAPKTFDVFAKDVGQVFGIALDDATPPNIYLAATSAFGLQIIGRGRDGVPERRKKGGPGVGWMKGQFGLDLQGGPGSIYKVDSRTGAVTLFANVTLEGVPNPGSGLGNLAYDSAHKQLFVSDLHTGMIHRFALDGKDLGPPFDHGVTASPTRANLPPQPFNPRSRPNIAVERFDSENPNTWGLAPPPRRIWALAVHEGRLYYSARNGAPTNGPQIWSVGIQQDGNFAADARWELDVADEPGPYSVSDIAFSQKGAMILAQRAAVAASYDYSAFTQPGEPRVLRYWLKNSNDPPSPGRWKRVAEEYAVGFAGKYRNTNGGIALGYGYGPNGMLNAAACEAALWTTAQNIRNNPALRSQLEPGGPLVVHGLQGSPADMVRNANEPPWTSYSVDYDDTFDDVRATGHMGSVRVYTTPCAPSASVRPVVIATPIAVPGGCVGPNCGNVCTPTCVCPPGTVLEGKECVKRECPPPQVFNPATGSCTCPPGTVLVDGRCVPRPRTDLICPPPQVMNELGVCVCPPGLVLINGSCVSVHCRPPLVFDPVTHTCVCPQGGVLQDGKCVPQICPPPLVPGPCKCPEGTVQVDGRCEKGTPIDLGIEKTGATTPVQEPFYVFDITVTNHGGAIPGNTVTVTDTVPPNMTFNSIGGPGWTCFPTSGGPGTLITCTYGPAVTPGQVLPPIHINATANGKPPYPPVTNCAVVGTVPGSGYIDSDPSNNQDCVTVTKPLGDLTVKKIVINHSPLALPPMTFPITVTCGSMVTTMNLADGGSQTVSNIPVYTNCSVVEGTITTPPNACPPRTVPVWSTTYAPPSPVYVTGPGAIETVTNTLDCKPVQACQPPQVLNELGLCVCPPPMVTGATPNTCVCPQGTTLVNGRCVPVDVCQPPLVMIPGVGCRCPNGEVLVGKECVKKVVCDRPLVPNAAGTGCVCRDGLVLRNGKCVEVPKPKPSKTCKRGYVWNGDMCVKRKTERKEEKSREQPSIRIPRGLPGLGGRDNPAGPRGGGQTGTPGKR